MKQNIFTILALVILLWICTATSCRKDCTSIQTIRMEVDSLQATYFAGEDFTQLDTIANSNLLKIKFNYVLRALDTALSNEPFCTNLIIDEELISFQIISNTTLNSEIKTGMDITNYFRIENPSYDYDNPYYKSIPENLKDLSPSSNHNNYRLTLVKSLGMINNQILELSILTTIEKNNGNNLIINYKLPKITLIK